MRELEGNAKGIDKIAGTEQDDENERTKTWEGMTTKWGTEPKMGWKNEKDKDENWKTKKKNRMER